MNFFATKLTEELKRRQLKNKAYSLRAFAKLLEIEPSALSKLMNGTRMPSLRTYNKIAKKIELDPDGFRHLSLWRKRRRRGEPSFAPLNLESFEKDLDNQHLIILEALRIPFFEDSLEELREAMDLDKKTFYQMVTTLQTLGFIECDSKAGSAKLLRRHNSTSSPGETSDKRKLIQRKYLQMAIDAVETVRLDDRDNSTLTLAISSKDFLKYKDVLAKFRRRLNGISERSLGGADAVYNFTFAAYPALKLKHKE